MLVTGYDYFFSYRLIPASFLVPLKSWMPMVPIFKMPWEVYDNKTVTYQTTLQLQNEAKLVAVSADWSGSTDCCCQ